MSLNNDYLKPGDTITVGKWLKKMGHFSVESSGEKRNVYALCKKGKFIPAILCEPEEAETIVNDGGQLVPFKRVSLEQEVKFGQTVINVFPLKFWKKATTKNLFLGMLEELQNEKPGMGSKLSRQAEESNSPDQSPISSGFGQLMHGQG